MVAQWQHTLTILTKTTAKKVPQAHLAKFLGSVMHFLVLQAQVAPAPVAPAPTAPAQIIPAAAAQAVAPEPVTNADSMVQVRLPEPQQLVLSELVLLALVLLAQVLLELVQVAQLV